MGSLRTLALLSMVLGVAQVALRIAAGDPAGAWELGFLLVVILVASVVVVLLSVRGVRQRWTDLGGGGVLLERMALGLLPLGPAAMLAEPLGIRATGLAYFLWFLIWRRLDRFSWIRALRTQNVDAVLEAFRTSWLRWGHPGWRMVEASQLALFLGGVGLAGSIAQVLEIARDLSDRPAGLIEWMEAWYRTGLRDATGAEASARRSLSLSPGPTIRIWSLQILSRALQLQGRTAEAVEVLEQGQDIRASREDRTDLRLQMIRLLVESNRLDRARREAREALSQAREPRHVGLTALAGAEVALYLGDLEDANRLGKVAGGIVPGVDLRAQVRILRARCLLLTGSLGQARYLLERALRDPLTPQRAMEAAGILLMVGLKRRDGGMANTALWVTDQAGRSAPEALSTQAHFLRVAAEGLRGRPGLPSLLSPDLPWMEALALAAHRTGDEHLTTVVREMVPAQRYAPYLRQLFPTLLEGT